MLKLIKKLDESSLLISRYLRLNMSDLALRYEKCYNVGINIYDV